MARLFKLTYLQKIPIHAKIITRKGTLFVRFRKCSTGEFVIAPVHPDGQRCRLEARK